MLRDADELIVTDDMHQRKTHDVRALGRVRGAAGRHRHARGARRAAHLGAARPPRQAVVLVNIDGFWAPFLTLLTHMKADTFIRPGLEVSFTVVDDAKKIVPAILAASTKHLKPVDDAVLAKF